VPRRRIVLALAVAVGAAIAAVALSGAFDTGTRPVTKTGGHSTGGKRPAPATGEQEPSPLRVWYTRADGTLNSVAITLTMHVAEARIHLQVLHTDASIAAVNRGKETSELVFQDELSTTDKPPAVLVGPTGDASPRPGWSFWSGTLYPSDWDGGCQTGLYQLSFLSAGEAGDSEWFRCRKG
jgi:hypothetical protein